MQEISRFNQKICYTKWSRKIDGFYVRKNLIYPYNIWMDLKKSMKQDSLKKKAFIVY